MASQLPYLVSDAVHPSLSVNNQQSLCAEISQRRIPELPIVPAGLRWVVSKLSSDVREQELHNRYRGPGEREIRIRYVVKHVLSEHVRLGRRKLVQIEARKLSNGRQPQPVCAVAAEVPLLDGIEPGHNRCRPYPVHHFVFIARSRR